MLRKLNDNIILYCIDASTKRRRENGIDEIQLGQLTTKRGNTVCKGLSRWYLVQVQTAFERIPLAWIEASILFISLYIYSKISEGHIENTIFLLLNYFTKYPFTKVLLLNCQWYNTTIGKPIILFNYELRKDNFSLFYLSFHPKIFLMSVYLS